MIGTKIGFYEIVQQIGQGGMGAVYLAEHSRIGNRKVVKVLLPEFSQNPQVVRRFENEARAAARLNHRNIIKIDDFGLLPNGQWYILMPFLEGSALDAFLASHGKLSIHQALHILCQICAALDAAHSAGVVHRDLKPANIFLTQAGDNPQLALLLDFGIAKVRDGADGPETQTGAVFGTPAYMAVEQFEDASRADARSDLFALGVIAYQMVTGLLPFGAAAGAILYNKQITSRPARPTGIPFEWAEILLRTLAVRPQDRPESARIFAIALASVTPEEPPFERSGAEILASVAREFVTNASAEEATVKHHASTERATPILWSAARSPVDKGAESSTVAAKISRPRGALAAPPVQDRTTLSVMNGHRDQIPQRRKMFRWRWIGAAAATVLGAVGAVASLLPSQRNTDVPTAAAAPSVAVGGVSGKKSTTVPLTIATIPTGAALMVMGRSAGNAPITVAAPIGEEIQIRAELPEWTPMLRTVRPAEASTITLQFETRSRSMKSERLDPADVDDGI